MDVFPSAARVVRAMRGVRMAVSWDMNSYGFYPRERRGSPALKAFGHCKVVWTERVCRPVKISICRLKLMNPYRTMMMTFAPDTERSTLLIFDPLQSMVSVPSHISPCLLYDGGSVLSLTHHVLRTLLCCRAWWARASIHQDRR